jgi:hypothetical protein
VNIKTLKQSLPYMIAAEIPTMLVGHHGVGKTQGVSQYAKEQQALLKILNLGTQEVGDIIGLADFLKDASGQNVATKFMMPDWAKEIYEFCVANPDKKAILFLDEINRAKRDVLQVIFPLLTEKRIHGVTFPNNFYVMGAMNPNTADYIVTDISDKALLDRFCHIKLQPSKQEFMDYAKHRKFESQVIQFLYDQPSMLQAELESFELEVTPSRRSWELVDKLMKQKMPETLLREVVAGLVGTTASTAFIKSLSDSDKPITGNEVLNDYDSVKKRVETYSDVKKTRQDLLKYTCDNLLEAVQGLKKKPTKDQAKNAVEFLKVIPKELSFDLCRNLYLEDNFREVIDNSEELLKILANARNMKLEDL